MGPITKENFNRDDFLNCFLKFSTGREIPLRVESINFEPFTFGPEITAYLVGLPEDGKLIDPIEKVIFHDPATIVIWKDKTKTVVKCQEGDTYSPELGLAMCIAKKYLGNKGNFNEVFKKWIPEKKPEPELIVPIEKMKEALIEFCNDSPACLGCRLDYEHDSCSFYGMRDEEVRRLYEIITNKKEAKNEKV